VEGKIMATQPLGGNRAYYTPSFFGSGNAAFDPSGGVGTAAIGEADALRALISAMLQGFTPDPGNQMSGGVDLGTGGSDFGSGVVGGDTAGGSEMPVDPITGQQTLNTISKAGQALGMISGMTGNPDLGNFLNTAGQLSGAVAGAYNDPVRQALQDQFNEDLEMAGLEGNIDYGSYGYNPAGVAAANVAPIFANVAGLSPILGGLAREGIMLAADPVTSTPADLAKSGVDALVPGILNGIVRALAGNTIGEQIKGALTPVETAVPVEDRSTYPGEAPAGKTPEQALAEMLAEGVNVNMLDAGIPQVSDTIEPMSTQLEASGSPQSMSVESPVGTVSDTDFFSAMDAISSFGSSSDSVTSSAESGGDFGFADASADGYGYY
jgi:hypothetical protein